MTKDKLFETLVEVIKVGMKAIMQYNLPTNLDNPNNIIPTLLSANEIRDMLLTDNASGKGGEV